MIPKILIAVNGGTIAAIATTLPNCQIVIVYLDHDSEEPAWVAPPREQDDQFQDGEAYLLFDGITKPMPQTN